MWFFQRPSEPVVTNEAYSRWLRASRPPFQWFLALAEDEQEQLALLGDDRAQDLAIAIGYAVRDPELADAGISAAAGDPAGEETLARRAMGLLVDRMLAGRQTAQEPAPGAPGHQESETTGGGRTPHQEVQGPGSGPAGDQVPRQTGSRAVSGPAGRRAPETMGGLGGRRQAREDQRQRAGSRDRRLLGRAPDPPDRVDSLPQE